MSSRISAECVARLDPLAADAVCAAVPSLNAAADVAGLIGALRQITPAPGAVRHFSVLECLAAMRDLGLLLGSIKRHGVQPLEALPAATYVLQRLAERTDMVPRDTVYHYAGWNPPRPRQRMYVGSTQEDALIAAVRQALPEVEAASAELLSLRDCPPDDPEFAMVCRRSGVHLAAMVHAIDLVRTDVTPDYFARVLRPFFEDIVVGGESYYGPAAAHVPLFVVDRVVWSAQRTEPDHADFQDDTVRYSPPYWRRVFADVADQPSLAARVAHALVAAGDRAGPELCASVDALCGLMRTLIVFRGRHAVLARAAYDVERTLYHAGSGGGTVELLQRILQSTRAYAASLAPHTNGGGRRPC